MSLDTNGRSCFHKVSESSERCGAVITDQVKGTINDWIEDIDITEDNGSVVVMPRTFLEKDIWYDINKALKAFDAEWGSAGKESRWIINS